MNEITLLGNGAPVGTLKLEPTDDCTQVRLTITAGGHTELSTTLTLSLPDAEAVSGMLSDAIEEVSDTIETLEDDARPTRQPEPEPVLVGEPDIPF
jgi:hypothetical protein